MAFTYKAYIKEKKITIDQTYYSYFNPIYLYFLS